MSTPRSSSAARLESASRSLRRLAMVVALALLTGVSAGSARSRPARDFYEFGGRIIPADNGSLQGVHVVATDARGSYEALLDSSGVFVGAFPAPPSGRVTLRVFSDS